MGAAATPETSAAAQAAALARIKLQAQANSGTRWFYWIAGLSLVNSVSLLTGGAWHFLIGLGVTQLVDVFARQSGGPGNGVAFAIDIVIAGVFVLFGVFALKKQKWAFIAGMIVYTLDGLIFLQLGDIPGFAFHLLALFFILKGLLATNQLAKLPTAVAFPPASIQNKPIG